MFYVLAFVLCLAVLFIVLAGTAIFCAAGFLLVRRAFAALRPQISANLLFALRTLPVLLALLVTLGFALPSFMEFEPHATRELIGFRLLLLAIPGGSLIVVIAMRTARIFMSTRRAEREWRSAAVPLQMRHGRVPIYCVETRPLLAVTGIFRPKIFVARSVAEVLSGREMAAAIAHEMAHVAALDNLKQVLLKITRPPDWMRFLGNHDSDWFDASELAADEGALARGASALDLSSALVKVGRLSRQLPIAEMIAASYLLPFMTQSSIQRRVIHLEKLLGNEVTVPSPAVVDDGRYWRVFGLFLLLVSYAVCLHAVLPWMHEVLEKLVR